MATSYTKPHRDLADQVQLLISRGMNVTDVAAAQRWLGILGYYRLSVYWYPYRVITQAPGGTTVRAESFQSGTRFADITALYDFDRELKLLLTDALERIEVAVRAHVGNVLGQRGTYAHLEKSHLDAKFTNKPLSDPFGYESWLAKIVESQRRSKGDLVKYFQGLYDGRLPAWVVAEVLDFGGLSILYSGLKRADRDSVAASFRVVDADNRGNGAAFANWVRVLNYLRNVCARHARLWNRNMDVQLATSHLRSMPALAHLDGHAAARLYGPLEIVGYLLRVISPDGVWTDHVNQLVETKLALCRRSPAEMGFPPGRVLT